MKHRNEKYQENWNYLKNYFTTNPSVLDAYAGETSWWETGNNVGSGERSNK